MANKKYLLLLLLIPIHAEAAGKTPKEMEFYKGCASGLANQFPSDSPNDHVGICTVILDRVKPYIEKNEKPKSFGCWKAMESISDFYGWDARVAYRKNCMGG